MIDLVSKFPKSDYLKLDAFTETLSPGKACPFLDKYRIFLRYKKCIACVEKSMVRLV